MRIAVDVTPLSHPRTGIGNYLRGLLAGLATAVDDDDEVIAFGPTSLPGKRRITEALSELPLEVHVGFVPFAHAWRTAWSSTGRLAAERFLGRVDVLHFSDWMYPPQRSGLRTTTVYDLVPLRFPQWVQRRTVSMHGRKYRNAAQTCDLVFGISRHTAKDVVELMGVPSERVRVAYPGVDPRFRPEGPEADLGAPYVLSVSTLEPRKNLPALLDAFSLVRARRPELELAIAGPRGWEQERLGGDGVRLLGFVSDERLAELYRGASAFAYPSRFEGFGLPVVEAMASGTPTVVSSYLSLDEASGDAAVRADPSLPADFASALERALSAPQKAVESGLAHSARFTWAACAEAMLAGWRGRL